MSQLCRVIEAQGLRDLASAIFQAMGSARDEALRAGDNLVMANLSGHDSHGVGMIPRYVRAWREGGLKLNHQVGVVRDAGAVLTLDGGHGLGQSIGAQAMGMAIERARTHGVCLMGLHDSHHLGRIGHWAEQAAQAGMLSLHFVNVAGHMQVAPWGGSDGRFGTNPFCAGIPRQDAPPLILDFATSAVAIGKTRVAFNKGQPLPEGSALDHEGRPTTDPAALMQAPLGALLPFGAHKGFGMAVLCELLGGAYSGGVTTRAQTRQTTSAIINGMLSVVIRPEALAAPEAGHNVDAFLAWVHASRPGAGTAVLEPGEAERQCRARRLAQGIPVDQTSWQQLIQAAQDTGVDFQGMDLGRECPAQAFEDV